MSRTSLYAGGRLLAAGALVSLALGCSGKKGPVLYQVKGSVRINGEPAEGVDISFTPVAPIEGLDRPLAPLGITGKDGTFRLMSFKPGDGAPAGEYQVSITYPMSHFNKWLSGVDRLKGKFADPKTAGLTAKVEPKSNELPPFELKADVLPAQSVAEMKSKLKETRKKKRERD